MCLASFSTWGTEKNPLEEIIYAGEELSICSLLRDQLGFMGHIGMVRNEDYALLTNLTVDNLSYDVHPVEMFTFASLISGTGFNLFPVTFRDLFPVVYTCILPQDVYTYPFYSSINSKYSYGF